MGFTNVLSGAVSRRVTANPTAGVSSFTFAVDGSLGPLLIRWRVTVGGTPSAVVLGLAINSIAATYVSNMGDVLGAGSFFSRTQASTAAWELGKDNSGQNSNVKFSGHAIIDAFTLGSQDRFINGQCGSASGGGWQLARYLSGWMFNADTSPISSLTLSLSGGTPTFGSESRIEAIQL